MVKHQTLLAKRIAKIAVASLKKEVSLAPKPGLVDKYDTGAHDDMDYALFLKSADALYDYFYQTAMLSYQSKKPLPKLFKSVRKLGLAAENEMLAATNGINTHKGAIFSFGLMIGAITYYLSQKKYLVCLTLTQEDWHIISNYIKEMIEEDMQNDFKKIIEKKRKGAALSNGEKLYIEHGISGIRGVALSGYDILFKEVLPFRQAIPNNSDTYQNLLTLLFLMSRLEDSNILHRGGFDGLTWIQHYATCLLEDTDMMDEAILIERIESFNEACVKRSLSPGGSADLLALVIFLDDLESCLTHSFI